MERSRKKPKSTVRSQLTRLRPNCSHIPRPRFKKMLSLSTAFHINRFRDWQGLLAETVRLGFKCLELNVEATEEILKEASLSVEKKEIEISSLHNYCPRLENLPHNRSIYSGYILNSDDDSERDLAVEHTRRTIEWASRLGAKAVVMHLGEVNTGPAGKEFARYVRDFGRKGMLYGKYWEALAAARSAGSGKYLGKLMESLDKILPFAADRGITLGLENRFYFHEMPNIEELNYLFEKYPDAPIGYWHDTGHAEMFVRQGWVKSHADFLKPFEGKTIGMHLHDLRGLSDHFAPGSGDFDFRAIKPFAVKIPLKVVEAHDKSTSAEVRGSIAYLARCGITA